MGRKVRRPAVPETRPAPTEYHDEYSETLGVEVRKLEDVLLSDTVSLLASGEPVRLEETAMVASAVAAMLAEDRMAVVVVDGVGRLTGILTDRDILARAWGPGDPGQRRVAEVMTRQPETLRPDDRIGYAVNRMMTLRCRTMPVVDGDGRPLAVVTVGDLTKWLAALFPEATLNLRPGDRLRHPAEVDGG